MATMMVLQYVNNIGSKEQNITTMMVLQCLNDIGSKGKNMATMMAVRNRIWQQCWSYNV
jgi:hypothetical protein